MAVFTEQELMQDSAANINAETILENAAYLTSGSSMLTPKTVAVTENSTVQAMVVRFGDIEALSEEYGYDYIDAIFAVAEANDIDPQYLAVAVNEADIITNPDMMDDLMNVVINPQSEDSVAYQFCEAMVDNYAETEDEAFLEAMVDDEAFVQLFDTGVFLTEADTTAGSMARIKSLKDEIANLTAALGKGGEYGDQNSSTYKKYSAKLAKLQRNLAREEGALKANSSADRAQAAAAANSVTTAKGNVHTPMAGGGSGYKQSGVGKGPGMMSKLGTFARNNKGKIAAGLGVAAAAGAGAALLKKYGGDSATAKAQAVLKQAAGKDKNWIGKKIASLRSLYQKWLSKANAEKDAGRASAFKRVAASIMNVIDALMKKLEGSVGTMGK